MIRLPLFVAALCAAMPVLAQQTASPPPFQDFTFKRVKPPAPGARNRIDVQIAPAPLPSPRAAAVPGAPSALPAATFWAAVSPGGATGDATRFPAALAALRGGAHPAPRLQTLQDLATRNGRILMRETIGTRVSPALALAVISVESGGDPAALSRVGAQGLMQLMPATATRFDVADPFDPAQNIAGGVAFLDLLLRRYDGDPVLALAAYNAGEGAVRDHDGVPPFAETRAYVPKVLAAFTVARGLCLTPPELVTDGCVFAAGRG
ncbi:MAG: lytic transglycosylase domain-containing protein [Shimia sp.]